MRTGHENEINMTVMGLPVRAVWDVANTRGRVYVGERGYQMWFSLLESPDASSEDNIHEAAAKFIEERREIFRFSAREAHGNPDATEFRVGDIVVEAMHPEQANNRFYWNEVTAVHADGTLNVRTFDPGKGGTREYRGVDPSAALKVGSRLAHLNPDAEEESEESSGPREEDIVTEDHMRWYRVGDRRRVYFTGDEYGLAQKMNADKFWPNVWWISDHGNAHMIDMSKYARR